MQRLPVQLVNHCTPRARKFQYGCCGLLRSVTGVCCPTKARQVYGPALRGQLFRTMSRFVFAGRRFTEGKTKFILTIGGNETHQTSGRRVPPRPAHVPFGEKSVILSAPEVILMPATTRVKEPRTDTLSLDGSNPSPSLGTLPAAAINPARPSTTGSRPNRRFAASKRKPSRKTDFSPRHVGGGEKKGPVVWLLSVPIARVSGG